MRIGVASHGPNLLKPSVCQAYIYIYAHYVNRLYTDDLFWALVQNFSVSYIDTPTFTVTWSST